MPDTPLVVRYDPRWPRLFGDLGGRIRTALGDLAIRIDHIGATAVAGLDAKPIIDIQARCPRSNPSTPFDPASNRADSLGGQTIRT